MKEKRKNLFEELIGASMTMRSKIAFLTICVDMLCQFGEDGIDQEAHEALIVASEYMKEAGQRLECSIAEIRNAYKKEKGKDL